MKYIFTILLILMANQAMGGTIVLSNDSLPYTLTSGKHSGDIWDTVTFVGNLTTATNGIDIESEYWYIHLDGNTLSFGSDSGTFYGVQFSGSFFRYVTIDSGAIIHNAPEIDTVTFDSEDSARVNNSNCIEIGGSTTNYSHHLVFRELILTVKGYNGQCIYGVSRYAMDIIGGTFRNECVGYDNRCDYDGAAVLCPSMNHPADMGAEDYNLKICSLTIETSPGQGIAAYGQVVSPDTARAEVLIFDNNLTVDKKCINYIVADGDCHSDANAYALLLDRIGIGSLIYGNTVRSGENRNGGRGMTFQHFTGAVDSLIEVYDNDVVIHEGPNVEFPDSIIAATAALKMRYNNTYFNVYDNIFKVICDSSSVKGFWPHGHSFTYETETAGAGNDTLEGSHGIFQNNTLIAISRCAWCNSVGVVFDDVDGGDSSLSWIGNTIEADSVIYRWGGYDGHAHSIWITGDTINLTDSACPTGITFQLGWLNNVWPCNNIWITDVTYQGDAAHDDIYFSQTSQICDIRIRETMTFYVIGDNDSVYDTTTVQANLDTIDVILSGGAAAESAYVKVVNDYGYTIIDTFTNISGIVSLPIIYRYEARARTDSTAYNDFISLVYKNSFVNKIVKLKK